MKRKATFYLEHELLRAMRGGAARSGKPESQVVEEALRAYQRLELLEHVGRRSRLGEAEALALANEERHR
jgi:hypothetical protein